jgi:hypothetical protein
LSFDVNTDEFLVEYGCGICYNDSSECFIDSLVFTLAEDRYIIMAKKPECMWNKTTILKEWLKNIKKCFAGFI